MYFKRYDIYFLEIYEMKKHSFTLIELVTLIVLALILIAMLFPMKDHIKGKARASSCIGNLKQTGVAFAVYANENNDLFPAANFGTSAPVTQAETDVFNTSLEQVNAASLTAQETPWYAALGILGYLPETAPSAFANRLERTVANCPEGTLFLKDGASYGVPLGNTANTAAPGIGDAAAGGLYHRRSLMESQSIIAADSADSAGNEIYYLGKSGTGTSWNDPADDAGAALRHNGRANVLFADGGAAPLTAEQITENGN